MHVLLTLIIGLFAGAIAKMVLPGRERGGFAVMMLLGIAGAALAGFIGRGMGLYQEADTGASVIAAVIGAVVLLATYWIISPRKMAPD